MKKLLNKIKWFFFHYIEDYHVETVYFEDLFYYEYTIWQYAKILCIFNIKINRAIVNKNEYLRYYDLDIFLKSHATILETKKVI